MKNLSRYLARPKMFARLGKTAALLLTMELAVELIKFANTVNAMLNSIILIFSDINHN